MGDVSHHHPHSPGQRHYRESWTVLSHLLPLPSESIWIWKKKMWSYPFVMVICLVRPWYFKSALWGSAINYGLIVPCTAILSPKWDWRMNGARWQQPVAGSETLLDSLDVSSCLPALALVRRAHLHSTIWTDLPSQGSPHRPQIRVSGLKQPWCSFNSELSLLCTEANRHETS